MKQKSEAQHKDLDKGERERENVRECKHFELHGVLHAQRNVQN